MASSAMAVEPKVVPDVNSPTAKRRPHIHFMHNFRAFAIVLVVASHCYDIAWNSHTTTPVHVGPPSSFDFIINAVSGATALFVFVAGFFFHYVFADRFTFTSFLTGKAKKLLLPYIAVTICLVFVPFLLGKEERLLGQLADAWWVVPRAIISGHSGPAMWFVPFILIIFILSPLFLQLARLRQKQQLAILAIALVLGLCINRSTFNIDKVQNVGYFAFFYLLGIYCSARFEPFVAFVRRRNMILASGACVLLLAIGQQIIGPIDNPEGAMFEWTGFNLQYLQKIAWIMFLCGFLARYADRPVPLISQIASWSFGIFFLHQLALFLLEPIAQQWTITLGGKYLDLALWWVTVSAFTLLLVWAGKQLLNKRSPYVIGA